MAAKTFTKIELLKHRVQICMKVHGLRISDFAKKMGVTEGHLSQVLYYGRESGEDRAFRELAEIIGFDPRYGVSPEVRDFLNKLANPPRT